jgi:hypothetical protein
VHYTWGNSHKIYIISIPPKSDMYVFLLSLREAKALVCVDYSIPITRVGGIQLNFFAWLFLKKFRNRFFTFAIPSTIYEWGCMRFSCVDGLKTRDRAKAKYRYPPSVPYSTTGERAPLSSVWFTNVALSNAETSSHATRQTRQPSSEGPTEGLGPS